MGKIILEGMEFRAPIGVGDKEKILGNKIIVNIILTGNQINGNSDALTDVIDYSEIYSIVKVSVMRPANLLEHAAKNIINGIKERFEHKLSSILVQIKKMHPPLDGIVESSGVELQWELGMP